MPYPVSHDRAPVGEHPNEPYHNTPPHTASPSYDPNEIESRRQDYAQTAARCDVICERLNQNCNDDLHKAKNSLTACQKRERNLSFSSNERGGFNFPSYIMGIGTAIAFSVAACLKGRCTRKTHEA
ncbi:MAG: hypothetical protein JWO53_978 [Chlamydiia bacterium]|nr:hypothetical protein [Chlamydiia bacterium]